MRKNTTNNIFPKALFVTLIALFASIAVKALIVVTPVSFTASTTAICAGDSIQFNNTTTGATGSTWSFPGGTPTTSTSMTPTIIYSTPGVYSVTLTSTGSSTGTLTKTDYITVGNCVGNNISVYNYTGAIQSYTVPPCITSLQITATGAGGGTGYSTTVTQTTAPGATITATVAVIPGHVLNIVVGQTGTPSGWGGGGGGGSFVWDASSTNYPLIAAGGGGGGGGNGGGNAALASGQPGSLTKTPTSTADCGAGGTNGNNGAVGTGTTYGGTGAGWLTNGGLPLTATANHGQGGSGKPGAFAGGAPGTANSPGPGGYGGGGGGGCTTAFNPSGGGGGGGGFNGGGSGDGGNSLGSEYGAGGGGSGYYNGPFPYTTLALFSNPPPGGTQTNTGDGKVIIIAVGGISATTTVVSNSVACGASGSATGNPVSGTAPYTYSWSTTPVQTNQTATGLSAGSYTVTIEDHNGCSATASVSITAPAGGIAVTPTVLTNSGACANTGSISSSAIGGIAPYTYSWSTTPAQTNSTATGLSAGSYTITVFDHNGCNGTASASITAPAAVSANAGVNSNATACIGGSATVAPGGGTTPYTYLWTDPSTQTTATATGLSAGSYTVTVTDASNCSATASVAITGPNALTIHATVVKNTTACSSIGKARVTAHGGSTPYTYSWNSTPIQTTTEATGLSAGSYTIEVQDANGCSITASVNITAPAAVNASAIVNKNATACADSGSATASATGGLTPYSYSWAPGGQTTPTITGLSAGSYVVTVTDNSSCQSSFTILITAPAALSNTVTGTNGSGCNPGSALATPSGGTGPYTYSWNTTPVQTTPNATGLSAGSYSVTVTDASGCDNTSGSVTITATPPLVANAVVNNNSSACAPTGKATASATGGSAPYAYSWNTTPVQHTAIATGLSAGSYIVTVTDNSSCTSTFSVTITAPVSGVTANVLLNNNSSACGNTGQATASGSGGTGPYTYSWSTVPVQNTAIATDLSAGNYTVTVTDANGCPAVPSPTVTVVAPAALSQTNSFVQPTCGASNGSATVVVSGGTGPYTYLWTPGGQTNPTAVGLSAATYIVNVTDANGCPLTATVNVTNANGETITFSSVTNVNCVGGATGSITASVTGGVSPYTYSWTTTPVQTNTIATGLTAGSYTLNVTDANGCPATNNTPITQPATGVTVSTGGITNLNCSADTDGSAIATPVGGTAPYTYIWAPSGGTTPQGTYLRQGTYTVTVKDANGCTAAATATIGGGNPSPVVSFTTDSLKGCAPMCAKFTDQSTVGGGGTVQSRVWTFGNGVSSMAQDTGVCFNTPGAYNVSLTVTSNQGCSATLTKNNMLNVFSYPAAAFTFGPQPTDLRNAQISFSDKSTDKYGIESWHWSFGDLLDSSSIDKNTEHTYQDTGTFCVTLTVTNKNQCTDSVTNCLIIMPQFTLYIPTGFTPNGDGINDVFMPIGEGMESFSMRIFNRWGNLVFTSGDMKMGWNGRIGGTPGPQDVYIYDIEVVDNFGNAHSYIGEVALLQ